MLILNSKEVKKEMYFIIFIFKYLPISVYIIVFSICTYYSFFIFRNYLFHFNQTYFYHNFNSDIHFFFYIGLKDLDL